MQLTKTMPADEEDEIAEEDTVTKIPSIFRRDFGVETGEALVRRGAGLRNIASGRTATGEKDVYRPSGNAGKLYTAIKTAHAAGDAARDSVVHVAGETYRTAKWVWSGRAVVYWALTWGIAGASIYWMFFGGAKNDHSTMAVIGKIVWMIIVVGLILSGLLLMIRGDRQTIQQIAARHGHRLLPGSQMLESLTDSVYSPLGRSPRHH